MELCPCGSDKPYENCCKPIIEGQNIAQTAEQLMRSRYSAYANHVIDYIAESTHPDKRKDVDLKETKRWSEKSIWQGLEIINTIKGLENDNEGTVEFKVNFSYKGNISQQHEISNFKRLNEKWYFFDSESVPQKQFKRDKPKIKRNDPCPCGSGKKYKKCCGQ